MINTTQIERVSVKRLQYRIQCQPTKGVRIDRLITIFVGAPSLEERQRMRGLWFMARSERKANELATTLTDEAKAAGQEGRMAAFLKQLDDMCAEQKVTKKAASWSPSKP